jgi:hypothetical protein
MLSPLAETSGIPLPILLYSPFEYPTSAAISGYAEMSVVLGAKAL